MIRTNNYENYLNSRIDKIKGSDLQKQLENILPKVKEQYEEYLAKGNERLWQMENEGIINSVIEAKGMLDEYGSSQLVQKAMEDENLESEFDNARTLAFARLLEVNKKEMN